MLHMYNYCSAIGVRTRLTRSPYSYFYYTAVTKFFLNVFKSNVAACQIIVKFWNNTVVVT